MKIKITLTVLLCVLITILNGQVPQGFSYQAVMRKADGNPLFNTPVRIRFTVAEVSTNAVLYTENQSTVTNNFGLTSLIIGKGTTESGSFSNINWATPKKLIIGVDPSGGTNYTLTSTSDMQSVPFALNATNAVNAQNLISNVLTVNSSTQKIGIGNTSPLGKLTVDHDDDGTINSPSLLLRTTRNGDFSRLRMANTNRVTKFWDIAAFNPAVDDDARLHFFYSNNNPSGSNILTLAGSGKVGIGTTNLTGAAVTMENFDTYTQPTLLLRSSNNGLFTRLRFTNTGFSNQWWDIVGVANNNPDGRLIFGYQNATSQKDLFTFDRLGNAYAFGSFINSDKNLKKNVLPIGQSLPILMQLSGYRYNWKDEELDPTTQIGFIAQELEKLYPELVRTNDKGLKAVNYIGLIPIVVTAIKEQQQQIEDLKKEVAELKSSIKSIMDKR